MSAASESIFLSTSHSDTISTGATWTSRNRSDLPYHPLPISPTRSGFWSAAPNTYPPSPCNADSATPAAAPAFRNSRRFMPGFLW